MITKQQYMEILNIAERFLKIKQKLEINMSQDYQLGFADGIELIKKLVENK